MARWLTQLQQFVRYYGLSATVPTLIGRIWPSARQSQWYVQRKEMAFDRRFGVDTVGMVAVSELGIDGEFQQQAVEYSPTPGIGLGVVFHKLGIDFEQFTFVDIGCGKGRALFMAGEFPFARIIGVELSRGLCEACWRNIARCKLHRLACHQIECLQGSATDYEFPNVPLVVYLFNPFGAEVLSQVLERLKVSAALQSRQIIAVYCNPVHRFLFEESDVWQSCPLRNGRAPAGWAVYRSRI